MFGRKKSHGSVSSRSAAPHREQNGAINHNRRPVSSTPAPVLIQKFIVLHEGLMPLPDHVKDGDQQKQRKLRRNPTSMLSEDASLEEHGEFILYYYDHSMHAPHKGGRISLPSEADSKEAEDKMRGSLDSLVSDFSSTEEQTPPNSYATEDAVRFAGVCRALRSLPGALRPQTYDVEADDETSVAETEVVHLSDSTLVYVPLELDGDIVAIAQLPRAIKRQRQSSDNTTHSSSEPRQSNLGYGADPSAIQEAIRQTHSLFSLMYGGGIHRRLLHTRHLEQSVEWAVEMEEGRFNSSMQDFNEKYVEEYRPERFKPRKRISKKMSNSNCISQNENNQIYEDVNSALRESFKVNNDHYLKDYRYGGMKELFELRREYRKIRNKQREEESTMKNGDLRRTSMWGSCATADDLLAGISDQFFGHSDVLNRIDKLLDVLPITSLRQDLECYYDEWIWRMQGICDIMKGGVGRCVVEMIPAPLNSLEYGTKNDAPVRGQHPPLAPQPFVCLAGTEFMKSLLSSNAPQLNGGSGLQLSRLLGMSLFYKNRFMLSEMKNEMKVLFPPEIPYIISEYFHSYSQRVAESKFIAEITKHASRRRDNDELRPNNNALGRWMSNMSLDKGNLSPPAPTSIGVSGFAQPPIEVGNNEKLHSLFVPDLKRQVWLPRLHLPCPTLAAMIEHDDAIETHVAMFVNADFTFLLYFELQDPYGGGSILDQMAEETQPALDGSDSDEGKLITGEVIGDEAKAFAGLLASLDSQMEEFCDIYSERDSPDSTSSSMAPVKEENNHRLFQGEAGMDIIYVNRHENSFILLSQHDLSSNQFKRVAKNSASKEPKPKLLFGLGNKPKQEEHVITATLQPTHHGDILDCRHKLAAYLPLDVMHAFDDMFNEVGRLSKRRDVLRLTMNDSVPEQSSAQDSSSDNVIELCTFLPQGWVYCHANGSQELYILLDTSKFVTIADVQKASVRVRERITGLL